MVEYKPEEEEKFLSPEPKKTEKAEVQQNGKVG